MTGPNLVQHVSAVCRLLGGPFEACAPNGPGSLAEALGRASAAVYEHLVPPELRSATTAGGPGRCCALYLTDREVFDPSVFGGPAALAARLVDCADRQVRTLVAGATKNGWRVSRPSPVVAFRGVDVHLYSTCFRWPEAQPTGPDDLRWVAAEFSAKPPAPQTPEPKEGDE